MKRIDTLVTGGTVLTMDKNSNKFKNGAVAIDGDRIIAVGSQDTITQSYSADQIIDLPGSLIMPGLINAHTHAAMTCFRGIADDMELMDWLNNYIFPAEARNVSQDLAYWGSLLACVEMIKSGTTTFSDMYIFEDETARAAKQAGMRCLIGEVLFDFPSPNAKTPEEGLEYTEKLILKWADDPLINVMVEPHSLYTCSPDLLKAASDMSNRYQVPLSTHLLENKNEARQIKEKLGTRATSFLEEMGMLNERFFAFHCVVFDDDDMRLFTDHGCKVVHNPESNMKLASGVAPISAMLHRGITVGLGTDGCASNNNLDMFQEMDSAAKLEKSSLLDPTVMPAEKVVRMATCDGAKVLGMENQTGIIEPGKKADICIIDMNKPHLTPMYDEYSHLAYCVSGADVDTVLINGQVVMRGRRMTTVDEQEIMDRVREIAEGIRKSLNLNP
ncbi:amidohydrolase family protein [Desulfonatronovibrio magnus]|uniref:amidohydrolase family protein n=1 Tax=Desulfonatronovibrio magnus TaxID=698827 RepID=UPI0005EBAEED|nr:amidohydrolase [Desulfonatronovibrio magnus]